MMYNEMKSCFPNTYQMPLMSEVSTVTNRQQHQLYVPRQLLGPDCGTASPLTSLTHTHYAHLRKKCPLSFLHNSFND